MPMTRTAVFFLSLIPIIVAQTPVSIWGQCGGIGYTGSTTCAAGTTCVYSNDWYSQCQPSSSAPTTTASKPVTTTTSKASSTTTSAPATTSTPATSNSLGYQLTGRVPSSGANTGLLTWPNIGLKFIFSGTNANVTFTSQSGTNGFSISVDGSAPVKSTWDSNVQSNVTLSTGSLAKGQHTVQIFRVSEADHGTIVFPGPSGIKTDGSLVTSGANSRRIEFIGDSITAGYGDDGVLGCTDSVTTENAGKTYAALLGQNFSADISVIAWSGRGVSRNYPTSDGSPDGQPIMPTLWLDTAASYSVTEAYSFPPALDPQAVVINLGTNDFAYLSGSTAVRSPITEAQYATAMENFAKQIRAQYPSAKIFMVSSVMLSDGYPAGQNQHSTQLAGLQDAKTMMGDANVFVVDLPAQGSDVGCDYHPLPATHQQMANILQPVMKSALGW